MYILQYFDQNKLIGQFEYPTLDSAQNALQENDIWNNSTRYKIVNNEDGTVEEEDEFENGDSIWSMMFPDEESQEGFDVDDFFDNK